MSWLQPGGWWRPYLRDANACAVETMGNARYPLESLACSWATGALSSFEVIHDEPMQKTGFSAG